MKATKQSLEHWLQVRENIKRGSPVDRSKPLHELKKERDELESDPQKWKEFFFPHNHKYPTPDFHKKATLRLIKNFLKLKHCYEVRHWVRNLAKTTLTMEEVLYLVLTGKLRNILYISSTYDAAETFLERYRAELDSTDRIKFYYGEQEMRGSWEMGNFTT